MIEFHELPKTATLLAPTHTHSALCAHLLNETVGSMGLTIASLQTFLLRYQTQDSYDELDRLLQYRKALQTCTIHVYKNIVDTLDFLQQCATFIEDMKLYNILPNDLPQTTQAQIEMQHIISTLYPIVTNQDIQNDVLAHVQTLSLHDVYILDTLYHEREEHIYRLLVSCGAKRVRFSPCRSHTSFYHAVNKRKEVEAAAQEIIRSNRCAQEINIIVCDPSYKPLLRQIFQRYHIPFTIMKESHTSMLTKRFTLLFEYVLHPSTALLLELLETNTFQVPYLHDLVEYIQIFHVDIFDDFHHVRSHATTSELISEEEISRLSIVEEHANLAREQIAPMLQHLLQYQTMKELFLRVNEIASAHIKATDTANLQTLQTIHEQLMVLEKYLEQKADIPFAIDLLSTITQQAKGKQLHGALISDASAPLPPAKTLMMFGCTQKAYPAFPAKKGLFDEAYVRHIAAYPSMRSRYDLHMQKTQELLQTSPELIVSYPLGGYDGKGYEAALEMEEFLGIRSSKYPLHEQYVAVPLSYTIHAQTAQQLFLKDQVLHGSISAFETYQRCPFAYFLNYGLRLRKPMDYGFSQSRIGTLAHYVLEVLVNRHGKAYVDASQAEIEEIIVHELQALATLYPNFQMQVQSIQQRILHSILKNIEYLQELETHAHLAPFESEHEFWWDLAIQQDVTMRLHGFIDRIDASAGFARIIDYKSSSKSLVEQDVFSGLQLQLLTYALHIEEAMNKTVLGSYYYSLKHENIAIAAGKMTRRPVAYIPQGLEDYKQLQKASKRMRGWTMDSDVDVIDDDGTHIYGVRQNKDGLIVARKTYDLKKIKEHFHTMYQSIGSAILNGNINCAPTAEACLFCPYGDVCRFKGYPRKADILVELDDTIYKGGA